MNPQPVSIKSQLFLKSWLSRITCRLSIRQKIVSGYVLALSIAVLGTTGGTVIGNHYEQEAIRQEEEAQEEIGFLNRLQASSLQTQTHPQKLIYLLGKPELLQREIQSSKASG